MTRNALRGTAFEMLLLIDIGNTNVTISFCDKCIENIWRFNTILARDTDEYAFLIKGYMLHNCIKEIEGAVMCSVVPEITPVFTDALKKNFGIKPVIVSSKLKTGLKFHIKNPKGLGADRIANAAAAHKLYKGDLIVIDFGTATTFCVITAKGKYMGGAIMPGLNISVDALCEKTAKLPTVKLSSPQKTIGDDTISNMLSGLILGHAGAVERIIKEIRKEMAKNVTVIATGGLASLIVPYIKGIKKVNPHLTLEGLRIIYELNA